MEQSQQVVLISGASRGIGAATAREMGRRGYHVAVNYHQNADAAADVVSTIESAGGSAQTVQADVCDPEQVAGMIDRIRTDRGRIDALVCNANTVNPPFEPLLTLSWDDFIGKVIGELAGAYFLTQSVLRVMAEERKGRIVYVSSTAADRVGSVAAHSTAKAALNTFSRHVAGVAAQYGVIVNTVAFGAVRTDASSGVMIDDLRKLMESRSVFGRLIEADEAARSIAIVADDDFGASVGQVLRVDGGFDVLDQQLHPMVQHFE
ncbi:SDR family oxidoreductase [Streptomyces sp. GQFP]|uniref:SDR family oxidoreductase n=1 Tax=Streptomyces sp. GQFP TaxID=2907545 RepID=UPI001F2D9136|nr:SDR family oxidoreductase [Streptomyces sp. GQFP]UIX30144.1 SDR family oxidoreductase [Streptomyces sp. GQFP]